MSLAELAEKGKAVVRHDGRQILLVHGADGIFACVNRCPHEGYPLSEGTLTDGCVLTCNWHNWKFRPRIRCHAGRRRSPHALSGEA